MKTVPTANEIALIWDADFVIFGEYDAPTRFTRRFRTDHRSKVW